MYLLKFYCTRWFNNGASDVCSPPTRHLLATPIWKILVARWRGCANNTSTDIYITHSLHEAFVKHTHPDLPSSSRPMNVSRAHRAGSSKTSICKCQSWCTTLNPSTGLYEGDGKVQSRGTRVNHARDDKLRAAQEQMTSPSGRMPRPLIQSLRGAMSSLLGNGPLSTADSQANWIQNAEKEVSWLCELPVTSLTIPLEFLNDPATHGHYTLPSKAEIIQPNSGLHSLRVGCRANAAFLATESRFCKLITLLMTMERTDGTISTTNRVYGELDRLNKEKELQWVQQQEHFLTDKFIVNTGELLISV